MHILPILGLIFEQMMKMMNENDLIERVPFRFWELSYVYMYYYVILV